MNNYKFILATILILPQGVSYASQNQADGPQIKVIGVESKEKDSILPDPTPRKVEISEMSRYDCVYEYKINVGGGETYATILQIGEPLSKFTDYTSYLLDSIATAPVSNAALIEEMQQKKTNSVFFFDTEVWQNLPEGSMTVTQEIAPNIMGYEEPMGQIEWSLHEDSTKNICGYSCNRATASYGGREWTAWYTLDIPVSTGPWKLNGLPGLIMEAADSEGLHTFTAIAFREENVPIVLPDKLNVHFSNRDKVIKRKLNSEATGMEGIDPSMIESITVTKSAAGGSNIIINGITLRQRPNGYTPLEKE
jgi:GLPGLI family protein